MSVSAIESPTATRRVDGHPYGHCLGRHAWTRPDVAHKTGSIEGNRTFWKVYDGTHPLSDSVSQCRPSQWMQQLDTTRPNHDITLESETCRSCFAPPVSFACSSASPERTERRHPLPWVPVVPVAPPFRLGLRRFVSDVAPRRLPASRPRRPRPLRDRAGPPPDRRSRGHGFR